MAELAAVALTAGIIPKMLCIFWLLLILLRSPGNYDDDDDSSAADNDTNDFRSDSQTSSTRTLRSRRYPEFQSSLSHPAHASGKPT